MPALAVACGAVCGGNLRADDSAAVFVSNRTRPWVRALAEEFGKSHPLVRIEVLSDESNSGINELLQGNVDAALLARPATEEERLRGKQAFKKNLVGIPVAGDAVILFVRPDNPAKSITLEHVKDVLTLRIREWSALGVTMVESAEEEAVRQRRDARSKGPLINRHLLEDRFDSVGVLILKTMALGPDTGGAQACDNRRDLIHAVGADRFGLGFAGRGYAQGVKMLAVQRDAGSPAVMPTPETICDRSYPLAHYQYMYFAGQPEGPVKEFLTFILSEEGQRMISQADTGAVSLPFKTD